VSEVKTAIPNLKLVRAKKQEGSAIPTLLTWQLPAKQVQRAILGQKTVFVNPKVGHLIIEK